MLGFYFSEHPLEHLREDLERLATHAVADALQQEDGVEVRVAGIVLEVKAQSRVRDVSADVFQEVICHDALRGSESVLF